MIDDGIDEVVSGTAEVVSVTYALEILTDVLAIETAEVVSVTNALEIATDVQAIETSEVVSVTVAVVCRVQVNVIVTVTAAVIDHRMDHGDRYAAFPTGY